MKPQLLRWKLLKNHGSFVVFLWRNWLRCMSVKKWRNKTGCISFNCFSPTAAKLQKLSSAGLLYFFSISRSTWTVQQTMNNKEISILNGIHFMTVSAHAYTRKKYKGCECFMFQAHPEVAPCLSANEHSHFFYTSFDLPVSTVKQVRK